MHPAEQIIEDVCEEFCITREQLRGDSRDRLYVQARNVAIRKMRERGMSLPAIGLRLNRDHTSILYHLKKYPDGYGGGYG